jgi:uncharacterized protein YuzE
MKITYDPTADAVYIRFTRTTVTTEHWTDSIAADYDADGHLAGIEILDASKVLSDLSSIKHPSFEEYPPVVWP